MARKPLFGRAPQVEILKGLDFDLPRDRSPASSANRARANRRSAARWCGCIEPTAGTVIVRRPRHHAFAGGEAEAAAARSADDLPGPDVVAQPAPHHRRASSPRRCSRTALATACASRVAEALRAGRPAAKASPAAIGTSCPAASASASASPAPWRCRRNSCWPTRSSRASTSRPRRRSSTLLERLAAEMGLTVAFISHDLSVIRRLCRQVIVMRNGVIVEAGPTDALFAAPQQPTRAT